MKSIVVIPTYEERKNITAIIEELWKFAPDVHVLVVDDNSPDGTASLVQDMMQVKPEKLFLLKREGKGGLGSAYVDGFRWALSRQYKKIIEMDADFSHSPSVVPVIIDNLDNYDAVVGSRYVEGGHIENWSLLRRLISLLGSFYSELILKTRIKDLTGGFNGWTSEVLETIDLNKISSQGYTFQIELKYRAKQSDFRIVEIPITFSERREGQSKMSIWIVLEAIYKVWKIRISS